jgi:hypothetical protein
MCLVKLETSCIVFCAVQPSHTVEYHRQLVKVSTYKGGTPERRLKGVYIPTVVLRSRLRVTWQTPARAEECSTVIRLCQLLMSKCGDESLQCSGLQLITCLARHLTVVQ